MQDIWRKAFWKTQRTLKGQRGTRFDGSTYKYGKRGNGTQQKITETSRTGDQYDNLK